MKRIFAFMLAMICIATQMYADKVSGSQTLPDDGRPEHLYTMKNANNVYVGKTTAPTQSEDNYARLAFYEVEGVKNAYYIYNRSNEKWLTYTKAAAYSNGKDFVKFANSMADAVYFIVDNYSGDNYQISPVTTSGNTDKYINWYQGVGGNPYDGANTLGLWQDNASADAGSCWLFTEVVYVVRTYTLNLPDGITVIINGKEYGNGDEITVDGSLSKGDVMVNVAEGEFAVVSIDDVNNTITVSFAVLPVQPQCEAYTNAWVYPRQQDNVGAAQIEEKDGVYTISNKVLAASYMKVGDALYFAGSNAMNLVAGTEPFTVAFGNGDNVPASAMTLKNIVVESLSANGNAVGGAEHFAGKQIVANYEYVYNGSRIDIVWRAVLRDGSHYLRTEMELLGVDDVDMFNVIPMIYNVDTEAAGSTPKVVGNTRGAVLMSDKIFAGLETPTAYNTVGEAAGEADPWELAQTLSPVSLTASSWKQLASDDVPYRVTEATGAGYPNVLAYTMKDVVLKKNQKVEIEVKYTAGNHRLNFGGADLLDGEGGIAAVDYHSGYSGGQHSNNTFSYIVPNDGTYSIRVFVEDKTEDIDASCNMTVKIYEAKEGAVINSNIVGIQGRWSRNTTLAAGETWKVAAVVGLVAQDGNQSADNIHESQKRRSFLAYSERERAVPWRAFPHYNSWYELNIDRNNASPGNEHTNFTSEDIVDVMKQWKTNYYDKFGEGLVAFVIDDGWDNYGPWTFHSGFPNEMRDMAALAEQMDAGIGAWLGPVGGYGQSGNYRRAYWNDKGGMQLSNPAYYKAFKDAAYNLVKNQGDYKFFKFDGISAQFSAVGPDAGDVGNENAEGIIRLERYVREELREDIFFNTTVGTWASPFWYQISDATWRQENDYGEAGNNSIDREKWITYRDRLVYQNYVSNSPICPINTLMTHGFILTKFGAVSKNMTYEAVLRELRCAFLCGSGIVELYTDYSLLNSINNGKLWEDIAECIAWQKKNADVLPDAHWVGGNPWTGSVQEVYGWASWNGVKATLALRNGSNSQQTYTFTLREALNIPANITGTIILEKSFKVQDALTGIAEGEAIDIDKQLTVTLPGSSLFAFDGINPDADPSDVPFKVVKVSPVGNAEMLSTIELTFSDNVAVTADPDVVLVDAAGEVVTSASCVAQGNVVTVTLGTSVTVPGKYTLRMPQGTVVRVVNDEAFPAAEFNFTVVAPIPLQVVGVSPKEAVFSLKTIEILFNKEIATVADEVPVVDLLNGEGAVTTTAACAVEGNVLVATLKDEVTSPGEYSLIIPAGVVVGKAIGDAYSDTLHFAVKEFDVYEPSFVGTKTRSDRNINAVKLSSTEYGEAVYELTPSEATQDYTNATAVATFKVAPGETVTATVDGNGSWIHYYVYVDYDGDGFEAAIEEGSTWKPAGDLVAYSFYNNDDASDELGWNSLGEQITGGGRNKPSLPSFVAPDKAGKYRMRFKQDWSNIDPMGDVDGKFGDFKENGGQIVDVILEVVVTDGIETVNSENNNKGIYDLTGRRVEKSVKGIYIIDGKKQFVK